MCILNLAKINLRKSEISNLHEEWKIQHFQILEQASKNGMVVDAPPPPPQRSPGPCYMQGPEKIKLKKVIKKI
jgi:hypothetical protein